MSSDGLLSATNRFVLEATQAKKIPFFLHKVSYKCSAERIDITEQNKILQQKFWLEK